MKIGKRLYFFSTLVSYCWGINLYPVEYFLWNDFFYLEKEG